MTAYKRKIYILLTTVILLCVCVAAFLLGDSAAFARANGAEPKFSVEYKTTGLVEGQYYEKSHVVTAENGNDDYGLVPATTWGSAVDLGDGYIIYKVQSSGDTLLKDVKLNMNAYFGYTGLSYYGGKTNIVVSVSGTPQLNTFREVLNFSDLANDTAKQAHVKTKVTGNPNNQGELGGQPIAVGTENLYGMNSVISDYEIDLSALNAVGKTQTLYVKLDFVHLSYQEIASAAETDSDALYTKNAIDAAATADYPGKFALTHTGTRLYSVAIDYTEAEDTDSKTYSDDVSFDFNEAKYQESGFDWNTIAYDMAGLTIVKNVPYTFNGVDGSDSLSTLGVSSAGGNGYITFKFVAPEGKTFQTLKLTALARLADYNKDVAGYTGEYGSLNYYVGRTTTDYTLGYQSAITGWVNPDINPNGVNPENTILLDKKVRDEGVFYLKIEIGSNNETWTNLAKITIDVGFESSALTNDFKVDFNSAEFTAEQRDFSAFADEVSGLKILGNVDYNKLGSVKTLAVAEKNTEGYIVFRFKAPDNQSFRSLNVSFIARLFDNDLAGTYEKLDVYVARDKQGEDYQLVHKSLIEGYKSDEDYPPYGNCNPVSVDCDRFIYGANEFFVKVVIGCTATDLTWTNLKEISFDVEYEQVNVTVNYGGETGETFLVEKGATIGEREWQIPSGFVRSDDKLYLSADCTEDSVLGADTPVLADTLVYVKGEWGFYSVNYVLFDGTNGEGNADRYVSKDGLTLNAPTKEGYLFVGWFTDAEMTSPIDNIAKGHKGNVTLYAKFILDEPIDMGLDYVPEEQSLTAVQIALIVLAGVIVLAGAGVGLFFFIRRRALLNPPKAPTPEQLAKRAEKNAARAEKDAEKKLAAEEKKKARQEKKAAAEEKKKEKAAEKEAKKQAEEAEKAKKEAEQSDAPVEEKKEEGKDENV